MDTKRKDILKDKLETAFRLLLVLVLVISLMPMASAFAEDNQAVEADTNTEGVQEEGDSAEETEEDVLEEPAIEPEVPDSLKTDEEAPEDMVAEEEEGLLEENTDSEIVLLEEEGQSVAPMAGTTITINTSSYNVLWNNLEAVLNILYPTPSDITDATTLKFTGSGSIAIGNDQSTVPIYFTQSSNYLNTLNIDTIDLTDFSGTLGYGSFANANKIQTVALGPYITELPGGAFYQCTSLTALSDTLANAQANPGVVDLGKTNVTYLANVWNPWGLIIGGQFSDCGNITTVTLGNTIPVIPYRAFYACSSLTTMSNTLSNAQANPGVIDLEQTGVTSFGPGGEQFCNCSALTTVTLGTMISTLPTRIFGSCLSLTTISDTVANAQSSAGDGVVDLEKTGITSFDTAGNQFRLCDSITTVTLGNAISSVPKYAFQGCTTLTTVSNTNANAQANPGVLDLEKTGVTSLPSGGGQFENCYYYDTLTLGTAIPSIPFCAFRGGMSLTTVSDTLANARGISKGLLDMERIPPFDSGGNQFIDCVSLNSYMGTSTQPLTQYAFTRTSSVFVPKTLSPLVVNTNAFTGSTNTKLYLKGPQATSPTSVTGAANISPGKIVYYYEVSSSTDGNGTIARTSGGFLPAAIETREVAVGNLTSGTNYVEELQNLTFTITPNTNYVVGTITANGVPVTPVSVNGNKYTFAGVDEDTNFYVTFNSMKVTYDDTNSTGSTYEHPTVYSVGDTVTTIAYTDPGLSSFAEPSNKGFSHWNTAANDSGTSYDPGDTFTFTGPTTLYAIYANLYKVEYDDNGGDGLNVPADDTGIVDGATHTLNTSTTPTHAVDIMTGEDVVFVGWVEGTPDTHLYTKDDAAPTTVTTVTISGADTIVYAVWGLDINKNGVPDVLETKYSATYHLIDTTGANIEVSGVFDPPTQETGLLVNLWSTAVTAPSGAAQNRVYLGWNTNGSGTPTSSSTITTQISGNTDIYLVYRLTTHPVTVTYQHKDGTTLTGPNQNTTLSHNTVFVPTVPSKHNLCLINWTLNGIPQNNTVPTVRITQPTNIVLIYGQDKNNDGKEDVTVTENCYCQSGTHLHGPKEVYVNIGDTYQCTPRINAGHTYASHKINSGTERTGNPRIANISAAANVTLIYAHNNHSVNVKYVDTNGASIGGGHDYTQTVAYQGSWSIAAGAIQGYDYQGWQIGNGALQSGNPSISSVTGDVTIHLVYKAQASPPPPNPTPPGPDEGNYDFVKKPNVKNVSAGETVSYTFANFGNNWPFEVKRYSITDKPDKGLDFVSASLPAFANGSGVTYDVIYYTSGGAEVVLHSGISAASPFSFTAPTLAAGEYITAIEIEFGTVPAGFGVGNTIDMVFKVWDNPPAKTLTNVGILFYSIGNKDYEFVTGEDGMIIIGGWFTAKMGDETVNLVTVLVALVGLSGGALYLARRRRHKA